MPILEGLVGTNTRGQDKRTLRMDQQTHVLSVIDYPHHEIHSGSRFFVNYSVASLGALETPDDTMTLTWTTPDSAKWAHFTFYAIGTGGWRVRFIEAPSGGAASPTGQLDCLNHNRNSLKESTLLALPATANQVNYDATLATGGVTLWDQYIPGGNKVSGDAGSDRDEIILKQDTQYQLSMFGADADPGTLHIDFYEHTDKT